MLWYCKYWHRFHLTCYIFLVLRMRLRHWVFQIYQSFCCKTWGGEENISIKLSHLPEDQRGWSRAPQSKSRSPERRETEQQPWGLWRKSAAMILRLSGRVKRRHSVWTEQAEFTLTLLSTMLIVVCVTFCSWFYLLHTSSQSSCK